MSDTIGAIYPAEVWDVMQYLFAKFNDHQIHGAIRLSGRLDEARLRCAVGRVADVYPLLRSRFVEDRKGACWEDCGFTSRDMVLVLETEKDYGEKEISEVLCRETDTLRGPQIKILLLRGKACDSLCIIINHMLCDGDGFKELLYLLGRTYSHLRENPEYRPEPPAQQRGSLQVLYGKSMLRKAQILLQHYDLKRHDNNVVLGLDGDRGSPFIVTHTIGREHFLQAGRFAKEHGATVNDLLLAAYLRALRTLLPGRAAAIQCILDLRKFLPAGKTAGLCNLTSNLVCDIGPDVGETFAQTLQKVKRVMDAEKKKASCLHLILLLEVLFRLLPYPLAKGLVCRGYRNPPLAMSNIGILDAGRLYFDGLSIQGAFITGSVKYSPYFQLAVSTFQGEATLSVAFHGTDSDRKKIRRFLRSIEEELPRASGMYGGLELLPDG